MPNNQYCLLSVMGPHAGETPEVIFERKINDIKNIGKTFWLIKSYRSKPNMVQDICSTALSKKQTSIPCYFISPSSPLGAVPTKASLPARQYSTDSLGWTDLPQHMSPVTGAINSNASALVFSALKIEQSVIDLAQYADYFSQDKPLQIKQGASTVCAIQKDMTKHPDTIKSRFRNIVAIGVLYKPYCVWLR